LIAGCRTKAARYIPESTRAELSVIMDKYDKERNHNAC
jgi:hypothetical protein